MLPSLVDCALHVSLASVACAAVLGATGATPGPPTTRLLFAGTFTDSGTAEGIYAFRFDEATGALTSLGLAAKTPSPAWIAIHPDGRHLYAANEIDQGTISGAIHLRPLRLLSRNRLKRFCRSRRQPLQSVV